MSQGIGIFLWIVQVLLALMCVGGGAFQIFKLDDLAKGVRAMREVPRGVWAVLGAIGIVAGLGLVLPGLLHVLPGATAIAALVVAAENAVISGLYLRYGDRPPLPYSLAITGMALLVAIGRLTVAPL